MSEDCCKHESISSLDGIKICEDCGLQFDEFLTDNDQMYNENWANGRCHIRKDVERSLYPDLENKGFPQLIIEKANEHYQKIIGNKIYRAKNRVSIVFACTYNAYIDYQEPQSVDELAKKFNLDKKGISNGLKIFAHVFKNSREKKHIKPLDLVPRILSNVGINENQNIYINDLKRLYEFIEQNSTTIRTSIPQSVAAGLVYYYLKLKEYPITRTEYAKVVGQTEITFVKVSNNISEHLNTTNTIKL
jgi:transcription initiation factor TFIIIB Brf1 subunit/transcription initiation factor TFIIB